jgi:hypothetical protein
MSSSAAPFIEAAREHGFDAAASEAALAAVVVRLTEGGVAAGRLYCFRNAGGAGDGSANPAALARPRLLLAFSSADAALGFAQGRGLGRSPRLVTLSLAQALATMLQRPAIGVLLVAMDEPAERSGLPPGVRVERDELLRLLAGELR